MTKTNYKLGDSSISYETTDEGYTIYMDETPWVTQTTFIPYKGDTMEESCIKHIEKILEDSEATMEKTIDDMTLEEAIDFKLSEIGDSCTNTIEAGMDITLSDGNLHHFRLTRDDQINIMALQMIIAKGETQIPYHEDNNPCKFYSVEDATTIINESFSFKTYHTTYCNLLNTYIRSCTDKEVLKSIYYGMDIPDEYKENEVISTFSLTE